ncbi:hypothetical protein [Saccharothrix longispora]|uniref:hypothetical protein n=1 Tax=Saccharothrix longispora TaxID=33920 RepID=UPI0028FD1311|nr:hypothetical protein [Saccharothrix longispora]MBY8848551.1 hypothetical protein [Saccharothrix sp. MB29]MDU0290942.1 hypothetical protein [Saccharothrix longispora]
MDIRDDVVREDPFATALRAAITARGLGLDRIQERLRHRGTTISVAALSYWQSGRRRPERRGSLVAVRHLEEVLDVPPGSLTALLGAPRARGRTKRPFHGPSLEEMWPARARLGPLLSRVDTDTDEALTRISLHVQVEVAADRGLRTVRTRQVLRANRDGVDRWLTVQDTTENGPAPSIVPLRSCRLGRVARDERTGVVAAELLFDRPLARGETIVVEHGTDMVGPPYPRGDDTYCRKFRAPIHDYVVEVRFDPAELPVSCHHYTMTPAHQDPEHHRRMPVTPDGYTHAVALGFGPGTFCVGWRWPDD